MVDSVKKQLFYFGDLDFLLKQEYFKDKLSHDYFGEFVAHLKNTELKSDEVVRLQYEDLSGNNTPVLLSKSIVNIDYVIHIDQPQQLTIKNHNFSEMECNIKSTYLDWYVFHNLLIILNNLSKIYQKNILD